MFRLTYRFLFAAAVALFLFDSCSRIQQPLSKKTVASLPLLPYRMDIVDSNLSQGYFFLFTYKMRKEEKPRLGQQMILDGNGAMVYCRWTDVASDFKVHADGRMSFFKKGKVFLMDSLFRIVDSVACVNGIETDSHDFRILPNGHYLLIGMKTVPTDLSAYPVFLKRGARGSKKGKIKVDVIQELDKNKNLVFEWDSSPFYKITDADPIYLNDTMSVSLPHINSVATDAQGNIVASSRYFNELIKINRATGNVMWRMGGIHNQFQFMNDSIPFLGQHDAHYLPNGNLLVFDNGYSNEKRKHGVRAIEYRIDEKTKQVWNVWSYMYDSMLVSDATGNARRLENGTTLIDFGKIQNLNRNITCVLVDSSGRKIFDLAFADTIGSYRAYGYAQLPFTLHRPEIQATSLGKTVELRLIGKSESCFWSTGERGKTIRVTQAGIYFVRVPVGENGFLFSKPIVVTEAMLLGK
ncbi:MAG: aryl-sulfate sulfotransferase [Bacteroidia bacterium]